MPLWRPIIGLFGTLLILTCIGLIVSRQDPPAAQRIAYLVGNASYDLYVMNADGRNPYPIATRTGSQSQPCWSPDGAWLVFSAFTNPVSNIVVASATGKTQHQITDDPQRVYTAINPTWSPDGEQVTFAYGYVFVDLASNYQRHFGVNAINVLGADRRQLTPERETVQSLAWSPDGQWITFVSDREGFFAIYRVRADGSDLRRLTGINTVAFLPTWSPDGAWLVFARNHPNHMELVRIRPNGSEALTLTDANLDFINSLAWSPDGQWIVFAALDRSRGDAKIDIFRARVDGSGYQLLTKNSTNANVAHTDRHPAWSPDGEWIAFSSNRGGGASQIYRMRPDGSDVQRLTDHVVDAGFPVWSPLVDKPWNSVRMLGVGLTLCCSALVGRHWISHMSRIVCAGAFQIRGKHQAASHSASNSLLRIAERMTNMRSALARSQRIPGPVKRTLNCLMALSTVPDPIKQSSARNCW